MSPPDGHKPGIDRIVIIRHGKPALAANVWINWRGYITWWQQYDAGGLESGQSAPAEVTDYAHNADCVISSPLRRALESARIAAAREPDIIDPDLVEAALPPPHLGPLRLRPRAWGVAARIIWYCGYSGGMESHKAARLRAKRMSARLGDLAAGEKLVFVAAHGWYNRMLKGQLEKMGWACAYQNGDKYWSHRCFERASLGEDAKPIEEGKADV